MLEGTEVYWDIVVGSHTVGHTAGTKHKFLYIHIIYKSTMPL